MSWARVRAALVVSAFAASLLGAVLVPLTSGDRATVDGYLAAYDDARRHLQAAQREVPTVLLQPPWRDDVLDALEARGLPAGTSATVALAAEHGKWPGPVLLLADAAHPLPAAFERRIEAESERVVGGVRIAVLDDDGPAPGRAAPPESPGKRAPARPRSEPARPHALDDDLTRAEVSVTDAGGKITPCRLDAGRERHTCPGLASWLYVGPITQTVAGQQAPCTWMHPTSGGHVVLRLPVDRLGARLDLEHALSDGAVQNGGGPVTVTARLGTEVLGTSTRTNARGWQKARFPVPEGQRGRPGVVEIDVTAANDGARHHCVRLSMPPAPAAARGEDGEGR